MNKKKLSVLIIIFAIALLIGSIFFFQSLFSISDLHEGDRFRDVSVVDKQGNQISLDSQLNKNALILFLSTECKTCQSNVDSIKLLKPALQIRATSFVFIFVHSRTSDEGRAHEIMHSVDTTYFFADPDELKEKLGIRVVPVFLLVDSAKVVRCISNKLSPILQQILSQEKQDPEQGPASGFVSNPQSKKGG
jgi:hypothetical protein